MRQNRVKFRTGDIFTFKLPTNEYMCGRIMLDVKQQCIRPKLLKPESPLNFFNGSILVEIYKSTFSEPMASRSEVLIPGVFIDSSYIESGGWAVLAHENVDPKEVEFPESLVGRGLRAQFIRGEIALDIDLQREELQRINVYGTKKPSGFLGEICLYYLGRAHEINNPSLKNIEVLSLNDSDLRFSKHRSEIYHRLGEDEHQSYFEMATRLGYDTERFYSTKEKKSPVIHMAGEAIILCPYCLSPVAESVKLCPACGEDTTCDALVEMTQEQYLNKERKNCCFCGKSMLALAPLCPACRGWQTLV